MVAAKRERNRLILERTASEVASVVGKASASSLHSSNSGSGIKKRKPSDGAPQIPARKNPRRGATSSVDSVSYKEETDIGLGTKKTDDDSTSDYSSDDGNSGGSEEDDHVEQISKKNTKRGRRKAVTSQPKQSKPSASQSNPRRVRKKTQNAIPDKTLPEIFKEYRKLQRQGCNPRHAKLPRVAVKDMSSTLEQVVMNGFRIYNRECFWRDFHNVGTEDNGIDFDAADARMKATAESMGRSDSNAYDSLVEDDTRSQEKRASAANNQHALVHAGDYALYQPILDYHARQNELLLHNADTVTFGEFDEEDLIPKEFLVQSNVSNSSNTAKAESVPSLHDTKQPYVSQEPLPQHDPVKYNNIVRKRHAHYSLEGIDRDWDREFGDGIDPAMFVEECCRVISSGDGTHDVKIDVKSSLDTRKYTSALLQRCWDRAVHAVSSTVAVDLKGQDIQRVSTKFAREERTGKEGEDVVSMIHREAMRITDSVLDLVASDGDIAKKLNGNATRRLDWKDVLKCLRTASEPSEEQVLKVVDEIFRSIDLEVATISDVTQSVANHFCLARVNKDMKTNIEVRLTELAEAKANPTELVKVKASPKSKNDTKSNQDRGSMRMDQGTLKATTMRLLERYGALSHKLPS